MVKIAVEQKFNGMRHHCQKCPKDHYYSWITGECESIYPIESEQKEFIKAWGEHSSKQTLLLPRVEGKFIPLRNKKPCRFPSSLITHCNK